MIRHLTLVLTLTLTACTASPSSLDPGQILVVDGDTVRVEGETYRLVGFDAPETYRAQCQSERELGDRATARLRQLVASGGVTLERIACSCRPDTEGTKRCNWGRRCGILRVHDEDVGVTLIREGLARPYLCGPVSCPRRTSWCEQHQTETPIEPLSPDDERQLVDFAEKILLASGQRPRCCGNSISAGADRTSRSCAARRGGPAVSRGDHGGGRCCRYV
jgi:endonuclease YncB( thermonuclease family)